MKNLILLLTTSLLLTACGQSNSDSKPEGYYAKKPLASCQGEIAGIQFKAVQSTYYDGSLVLETWTGSDNQYFIGYLSPGQYKGFSDFYVGKNTLIIRYSTELLATAPITNGFCTKL